MNQTSENEMQNAVILSSGMVVPGRRLTNQYFNELLGEDVDTWLRENLTIRERYWCDADESTADLSVRAAEMALKDAGLSAEALDLLIVSTDTPEYVSPATAAVVQHRLGARNAGTFDVNAACAGFVTALDIAGKYLRADARYRHALVIGAYAMSKYLDKRDKKTVTLFADGAGAVVLQSGAHPQRGYLTGELLTAGQYHNWMGIYAGGAAQPVSPEVLARGDHLLKFVKKFPKTLNPEMWEKLIRSMARRLNVSPQDVDHYFITQININSIYQLMDALGVPRERAHVIMDRYGYTGSACIPMAFDDAVRAGKVQRGDLLFFVGSGGGLAFAGAAFRY